MGRSMRACEAYCRKLNRPYSIRSMGAGIIGQRRRSIVEKVFLLPNCVQPILCLVPPPLSMARHDNARGLNLFTFLLYFAFCTPDPSGIDKGAVDKCMADSGGTSEDTVNRILKQELAEKVPLLVLSCPVLSFLEA